MGSIFRVFFYPIYVVISATPLAPQVFNLGRNSSSVSAMLVLCSEYIF